MACGQEIEAQFAKAVQLINAGDHQQAMGIAEQLVAKRRGKNEQADARIHEIYGICLLNTGKTENAIKAFEKGVKIYDALKPSEWKEYGNLLLNLSIAQRIAKQPAAAEKTLLKLLDLAGKRRVETPVWSVQSQLSALYADGGDLDKALTQIHEALQNYNKDRGKKDPANESELYASQTEYLNDKDKTTEATASAAKWVTAARRAYGPDDRKLADALQSQGQLLMRIQKTKEANESLEEAAKIYLKVPQASDSTAAAGVVPCLISLAWSRINLNQLREAESTLKQAKEIIDRNPTEMNISMAYWHNCAAALYLTLKDFPKAEANAKQTMAIYEKAYGKDHPNTNDSRRDLIKIYQQSGRKDLADQMSNELNAIPDATTTHDKLIVLEQRGWDRFSQKDYAGAEKIFTEQYQNAIKEHGTNHPSVAVALYGLINTCYATGDDKKGAIIYTRLSTFMKSHGAEIQPNITREIYSSLAIMANKLNKASEAKAWAAKWYIDYADLLNSVLSTGTQEQRLAFTASWSPYYIFATLNDTRALSTMVLRLKGVVMDSLLEERHHAILSKDPQHREAFAELARLKEQYRKLSFSSDVNSAKEAAVIQEQLNAKEQSMAGMGTTTGVTRRALRVRVEDVQAKLPPGALLIEFIKYKNQARVTCYGAVLIPPSGDSIWVPIPPTNDIDGMLKGYKFISNHLGHPQMIEAFSKQLHTTLWTPIEKQFPKDTKRLIISPDSELSFISFATLLDSEGKFLCEKFDIQYVASGRDLLRMPYQDEVARSKDTITIFADPEYLTKAGQAKAGTRGFSQLPGAKEEGRIIKEVVEGWKWKVNLLNDDKANEEAIRTMQAPRILHLATHGFYLDEMPHPGKGNQEANPMLKSGLALAGAEDTFRKWQTGKADDPSKDGILMADELGDLNLRGNWLVCLSACQTGSGEAKSGEGVLGLRRGFVEAGSQHLISTLWPIPDEQTVLIMKDFYTRLPATQDPPLTLSRVQRDWLIKLREESKSAGTAIMMAGAFITSSYGKPGT